jgi:hypothetical protein
MCTPCQEKVKKQNEADREITFIYAGVPAIGFKASLASGND